MQGTDFILDVIKKEGVDQIFMFVGSLVDPFLTRVGPETGVFPTVMANEAGAAYAADGYARATGKFGVCLVIGGPGAANAVGGIMTAASDRSPVLLLSGNVPTDWEGRGFFQDASALAADDAGLFSEITAFSHEVPSAGALPQYLHLAMASMLGRRSYPVHLSIPKDLQQAEITGSCQPLPAGARSTRPLDACALADFASTHLMRATHIAILAGNGVTNSEASAALVEFMERYRVPAATTMRAKGVVPEDHPLSLGVFGYAGSRRAIEALLSGEVEVLLVLGSSLNQRDTMCWNTALKPRSALCQVDLDPEALGRNYPVDLGIMADCRAALQFLTDPGAPWASSLAQSAGERGRWAERFLELPRYYDQENLSSAAVPMHPARVVAELRRALPRETVLLVDSGAHRAFGSHYWQSFGPRQFLSATTLGPMGWALAASIGVARGLPQAPVAVLTGDGCMLQNGLEIQTAARHQLRILYLVINNGALGNVYLRARESGPQATALTLLPVHDWAGFARSLGLEAVVVEQPDDLPAAFSRFLAGQGPMLLDARCDKDFATPVSPWSAAVHALNSYHG